MRAVAIEGDQRGRKGAQQRVAEKVHISPHHLSRFLRGHSNISAPTAASVRARLLIEWPEEAPTPFEPGSIKWFPTVGGEPAPRGNTGDLERLRTLATEMLVAAASRDDDRHRELSIELARLTLEVMR